MIHQLLGKLQGDRVIWITTFFLGLISLLSVYSAISTLAYKAGGNSLGFLMKHGIMLAAGFGVMYMVHRIHFKYFSRFSLLLIWVAAALLVITLLFGSNINSADRWIRIPVIGLTFQSSDFAKVVLMVYLARVLSQKREHFDNFKKGVLPALIPVGVICILILPANFSTAALIAVVSVVLMFVAGVPFRHLAKLFLGGIAGLMMIVAIGEYAPADALPRYQTWKKRLQSKMNKESSGNYQANLAKYAIYEGGIVPKGPGTGSSRNFLPHPYSDMIYAFIIEEYGSLFGGIGLVLLYLILLFRTVRFSSKCPKSFGALTAIGLSFMLVFQAVVNMGVAVSLFPTTGQPLPLVSMGGTSTIFTCLALGIILSISRSAEEHRQSLTEDTTREPVNNPLPA